MDQKNVTIEAAKHMVRQASFEPAGGSVKVNQRTLNSPTTGKTARRARDAAKRSREEKLMAARSATSRKLDPAGQPAPLVERTSPIDPRALSAFQRVLLATDGTLTDILEAYLAESMRVVKLHQEAEETRAEVSELELPAGTTVVRRRILLRGKWSHKNYLFAESILVPDRLNDHLRTGVFSTQKPLGQLIIEAALETRREILGCHLEPAADLARYFHIPKRAELISRTYRVFAEGKAIMLITEKFPRTYFTEEA